MPWYLDKFSEAGRKYGAATALWDQSDYISAHMPPALRNGVCQSLVAMWMASRANWSVFTNVVKSPGGKAHVRGFMNLQHEGIRIQSINGRQGVTNYFQFQADIFGIGFTGQEWKDRPVDAYDICTAVKSAPGYYYLNFYSHTGGHSVGFVYRADTEMTFFDPNCGTATFAGGIGLTRFLDAVLRTIYSSFNEEWYVHRYNPKR